MIIMATVCNGSVNNKEHWNVKINDKKKVFGEFFVFDQDKPRIDGIQEVLDDDTYNIIANPPLRLKEILAVDGVIDKNGIKIFPVGTLHKNAFNLSVINSENEEEKKYYDALMQVIGMIRTNIQRCENRTD